VLSPQRRGTKTPITNHSGYEFARATSAGLAGYYPGIAVSDSPRGFDHRPLYHCLLGGELLLLVGLGLKIWLIRE
jgi:hypothetical protein